MNRIDGMKRATPQAAGMLRASNHDVLLSLRLSVSPSLLLRALRVSVVNPFMNKPG